MSTRGFVGFVIDGVEKIAYNHFDSYPGGLGLDVLRWLRGADTGAATAQARALRVVEGDSEPSDEDLERLRAYYNPNVGGPSARPTWYQLLRETQGDPAAMLAAGVIEDGSSFPTDSLFAEYGYVVDFDRRVLEAYEGFQQSPHDKGRFAGRTGRDGYAPCALRAEWRLAELPTDAAFIKALDNADEEPA